MGKNKITNLEPFYMAIEKVVTVTTNGTMVSGYVKRGRLCCGDELEIVSSRKRTPTSCMMIEKSEKVVPEICEGDFACVLLDNISLQDVRKNSILATPNTIFKTTEFEAKCRIYSSAEGGPNSPFHTYSYLHLFFDTGDAIGEIEIPTESGLLISGYDTDIIIRMDYPMALGEGFKFTIREGGHSVGKGTVTKILE